MNIPYGVADFTRIRSRDFFYVDKTAFIPRLEDPTRGRNHLLFLRPRRFGKSLLISMLEAYYDVAQAPRR